MTAEASLRVVETFASIQGESTHAGRLCFFIRLAGCNLRCGYCDTVYAQSPDDGTPQTISELLDAVRGSGLNLVEITGGEPLSQAAAPLLCRALLDAGFEVMVETNGSFDIAILPDAVIKVLDCKTPSSGEEARMCWDNYSRLQPHDEIKFVIADRADYDYSLAIIERYRLAEKTANLIFSPAWGSIAPRQLVEWLVADRAPVRMQLQLHKYIWGPDTQGV